MANKDITPTISPKAISALRTLRLSSPILSEDWWEHQTKSDADKHSSWPYVTFNPTRNTPLKLDFRGWTGRSLPPQIGLLVDLIHLDLGGSERLKSLPDEIGKLKNLEVLDLRRCIALQKLPSSVGDLVFLKRLNLRGCISLKSSEVGASIPSEVDFLARLNGLNLTTELTDKESLKALRVIGESRALSSAAPFPPPPVVVGPTNGRMFQSPGKDIEQGAEASPKSESWWGGLERVQFDADGRVVGLDLSGWWSASTVTAAASTGASTAASCCSSTSSCSSVGTANLTPYTVPPQVGSLTHITDISFEGCTGLSTLPSQIGRLINLQRLNLNGCEALFCLPDEIGQLVKLEEMHLEDCSSLNELPVIIGYLVNLNVLHMAGCSHLKSLPSKISNLVNMTSLNLGRCRNLKAIPEDIGMMNNLQSLNLAGCRKLRVPPLHYRDQNVDRIREFLEAYRRIRKDTSYLAIENNQEEDFERNFVRNRVNWDAFEVLCQDESFGPILGEWLKRNPKYWKGVPTPGGAEVPLSDLLCDKNLELLKQQSSLSCLMFLDRFRVGDDPILHVSERAVVIRAMDEGESKNGNVRERRGPVALKLMRNPEGVLSEVEVRAGLNESYVVPIKRIFREEDANSVLEKEALEECGGLVPVTVRKGLVEEVNNLFSSVMLHHNSFKSQNFSEITKHPLTFHSSDTHSTSFRYLLVLELADINLHDAMSNQHLSITTSQRITTDLIKALNHIHRSGRVHGNVQPLNVVGVSDGSWKLIDLESAKLIGSLVEQRNHEVGGYTPPNVARVAVGSEEECYAQEAHDIWSLGVILFEMLAGRSLWHVGSDGMLLDEDINTLTNWSWDIFVSKVASTSSKESLSPARLAGFDLAWKLLHPRVGDRMDLFENGLVGILDHPFLNESAIHNFSNGNLNCQIQCALEHRHRQSELQRRLKSSSRRRRGLRRLRENTLGGMLESDSTNGECFVPTSFAILRTKLPDEGHRLSYSPGSEESSDVSCSLDPDARVDNASEPDTEDTSLETRDSSAQQRGSKIENERVEFDLLGVSEIQSTTDKVILDNWSNADDHEPAHNDNNSDKNKNNNKDGIDEESNDSSLNGVKKSSGKKGSCSNGFTDVITWLKCVRNLLSNSSFQDDPDAAFRGCLRNIHTKSNEMYLYLVDELTGKPVQGGAYPILIPEPAHVIPALLPILFFTMRSAALVHGLEGITRMFGVSMTKSTKDPTMSTEEIKETVEFLKGDAFFELFEELEESLEEEVEEVGSGLLHSSSFELRCLLEEKDPHHNFAGLFSYPDGDGSPIWTALQDVNDILSTIDCRGAELRAEELKNSSQSVPDVAHSTTTDSTEVLSLRNERDQLMQECSELKQKLKEMNSPERSQTPEKKDKRVSTSDDDPVTRVDLDEALKGNNEIVKQLKQELLDMREELIEMREEKPTSIFKRGCFP